jgi:hypothetical protein
VSTALANCARCHEGADAPRTAVLAQMAPERILSSTGLAATVRPRSGERERCDD